MSSSSDLLEVIHAETQDRTTDPWRQNGWERPLSLTQVVPGFKHRSDHPTLPHMVDERTLTSRRTGDPGSY